jgi:hypothetical protein
MRTLIQAADARSSSLELSENPTDYFGNFNTLFCASASLSDLLSLSPESSSRVSLQVRKALNEQLSPQAIIDKLAFLENNDSSQISLKADAIGANWCKFDLDLDFGQGKPFKVTDSGGTFPPGFFRLYVVKGDVLVLLAVKEEEVDGIKNDQLLLKYATFVQDL